MKPYLLWIAVLGISMQVLQAQQSSRFPIKPGSVWRINYEYPYLCPVIHNQGDEEYMYFLNGDTIIGSHTYFKLYKTGVLYLDEPLNIRNKYMGAIRDEGNRFYYIKEELTSEKLLYNFDAKEDELVYDPSIDDNYPVYHIDTLENGRKSFKINIMTAHCGPPNTLIEGIGWLGGLLEGNTCSGHPGVRGSFLICYTEDDQVVYQTDYTQCQEVIACNHNIITPIDENNCTRSPGVILMPDGQLQVTLPDDQKGKYTVSIFDAGGTLRFSEQSALPGMLDFNARKPGIYLLRITRGKKISTARFMVY